MHMLRTIGGIDFTGQDRATLNKLTMLSSLTAPVVHTHLTTYIYAC